MLNKLLSVKNLKKNFHDKNNEIKALEDITFDIYENEFVTLLGPSGCGKTTILRILIGLLKPTSGHVFKDGVDITDNPPASRGMGIVFQNYALFENMTVLQNVEYALKIRKENKSLKSAAETFKKVLQTIGKKFGLQKEVNEELLKSQTAEQEKTVPTRNNNSHDDLEH